MVSEIVERFRADKGYDLRRSQVRTEGSPVGQPFAKVYLDWFPAVGRTASPSTVLLLEMLRRARLKSVRRNDGWLTLNEKVLTKLGLANKDVRYRAVQRLVALDYLEVRHKGQTRLEYRLVPEWFKPKAEVIDLTTMRKIKR